MRLNERGTEYESAASNVFLDNLNTTYDRVEPVYKGSSFTARFLAHFVPTPLASTLVDALFTGTDFYVTQANLGLDVAQKALIRDVAVMVLMEMPSQSLGGKSVSDVIKNDMTVGIGSSRIYSVLNEQFRNPAFQKKFMSVLAKSSAAIADMVTEAAFSDLIQMPSQTDAGLFEGH